MDSHLRDRHWGMYEDEQRPLRQAADLAYHGAHLSQILGAVRPRVRTCDVNHLYRMLAPHRRSETGSGRSGGRPKDLKSILALNAAHKQYLVGMLANYHLALCNGAEVIDARLAAWVVFDTAREAGHIPIPVGRITLDLWLHAVQLIQKRRIEVIKCAKCGEPGLVSHGVRVICKSGGHYAIDGGPYFVSPDGSMSPIQDPTAALTVSQSTGSHPKQSSIAA